MLPFLDSFFAAFVVKVLQEIYYIMVSSLKKVYFPSQVLSHYAVNGEVRKTLATFLAFGPISRAP